VYAGDVLLRNLEAPESIEARGSASKTIGISLNTTREEYREIDARF